MRTVLSTVRSVGRSARFIVRHPLNRQHRLSALATYARWHVGCRLLPGGVAVPFVGATRLLVERGMAGATANIFCGLQEFQDMGVVLHTLRAGDLFVDAGANVGSYTVLAAGVCGASVIAIEPVPSTFSHLLDNIRLNNLESLVTAENIGLAASPGRLRFSERHGTMNHVLASGEQEPCGIDVPVRTLDGVLGNLRPTVVKIDVEGYEAEVLKGAEGMLQADTLRAVVMELNGSGTRYGVDEGRLHADMLGRGFTPCHYDPLTRALAPLEIGTPAPGNTLYVRDVPSLAALVASAPRRMVHGQTL